MKENYKTLCFPVLTREGWAYDYIPESFYKTLEELVNETKRDGYYSRADNLKDVVKRLEAFLIIKNITLSSSQ